MRLKNLVLGYSLPQNWINKISVNQFRIYVNVQNVFTITKYSGIDPENGKKKDEKDNQERTLDDLFFPASRTFQFGLSIGF
ncbi:MAG: TonB-dependent receptor [Bacteroidales bacterium]|nr:TonB-dependent receptor [Bacteroidales bacterium]